MKIPHEPVAVQEESVCLKTTGRMLGKVQTGEDTKSEDLPTLPYKKPRLPVLVHFFRGITTPSLYGFLPSKGEFFYE